MMTLIGLTLFIGFDNELLDAGQIGTPSAMEYEQEMPCQQQRENVSHHVLQPLQQNVSPLQHNMSPLHHDTSPPLQSAKVPNRQYSLSALMENKEEQRVEEQEVERQEEEPIHVPPVINYDKAYNKRIELEVESVKGNNKVVARTCGVAYNGNDEEKKFSDDMKNIIKSHCAALRTNKDLFRYMSYVTTHRLKCGYCMECKNDFKLVDI